MGAGLVGFICPRTGADVRFDSCVNECVHRCMSLPMIMAMASQSRGVEEGVYHVTEILNPPQVVHLSRTTEYFAHPASQIWMLFGTGFHTVMERGHGLIPEGKFLAEQNFRAEVAGVTLSGGGR